MIRLILVVLAVVLYLIFSIPVLSYLKNLEKKDPKAAAKKTAYRPNCSLAINQEKRPVSRGKETGRSR